jgi:hypothetical protein
VYIQTSFCNKVIKRKPPPQFGALCMRYSLESCASSFSVMKEKKGPLERTKKFRVFAFKFNDVVGNLSGLRETSKYGRTTQSVGRHNLSDDTICRTTQSVGRHKLSDDTNCRTTQSVGRHNLSDDTICRTTVVYRPTEFCTKFVLCANTPFVLQLNICSTTATQLMLVDCGQWSIHIFKALTGFELTTHSSNLLVGRRRRYH